MVDKVEKFIEESEALLEMIGKRGFVASQEFRIALEIIKEYRKTSKKLSKIKVPKRKTVAELAKG